MDNRTPPITHGIDTLKKEVKPLEGKLNPSKLVDRPATIEVTEDNARRYLIDRVNGDFTYHAPHGDQVHRYERMRSWGKQLAIDIIRNTPPSREQDFALKYLEEAIFWANAAVARNEPPPLSTKSP